MRTLNCPTIKAAIMLLCPTLNNLPIILRYNKSPLTSFTTMNGGFFPEAYMGSLYGAPTGVRSKDLPNCPLVVNLWVSGHGSMIVVLIVAQRNILIVLVVAVNAAMIDGVIMETNHSTMAA